MRKTEEFYPLKIRDPRRFLTYNLRNLIQNYILISVLTMIHYTCLFASTAVIYQLNYFTFSNQSQIYLENNDIFEFLSQNYYDFV
jgi:predicted PurR-regulated permease PerM